MTEWFAMATPAQRAIVMVYSVIVVAAVCALAATVFDLGRWLRIVHRRRVQCSLCTTPGQFSDGLCVACRRAILTVRQEARERRHHG